MDKHVHEWRRWGADFRCQFCKEIMYWGEQMRRINATERLSVSMASTIAKAIDKLGRKVDGRDGGNATKALRAYADIREGK